MKIFLVPWCLGVKEKKIDHQGTKTLRKNKRKYSDAWCFGGCSLL